MLHGRCLLIVLVLCGEEGAKLVLNHHKSTRELSSHLAVLQGQIETKYPLEGAGGGSFSHLLGN
jgi:hypothetical protein